MQRNITIKTIVTIADTAEERMVFTEFAPAADGLEAMYLTSTDAPGATEVREARTLEEALKHHTMLLTIAAIYGR